MKPIFNKESYYDLSFIYRDKLTGDETTETVDKQYSFEAVQAVINQKVEENAAALADGGTTELAKILIDPKESVDDTTSIVGWTDMRPGDYWIHSSSPKTVDKEYEIDYEFYVCKVSRTDDEETGERKLFVDHYQMIWLFYQGCYMINRYTADNDETKLLVLEIYDSRLCPNIETVEAMVGRQWVYAKIAKYAGMYALESPTRLELDDHMG